MNEFANVAVLGAGVIGASWTALFLASGRNVAVFDPAEGMEGDVREYVKNAWPTLVELGLVRDGAPGELSFHRTAGEAVSNADFIQESVPERIHIKHALYAEIEPLLKPGAIVASSASGLPLSEMQAGWKDPSRFVLGHPFNPPHLIPLVEVMGNQRTAEAAVEGAERFYEQVGKVTIRVHREVPGHVANRLQAALWREAIHLVKIGAASVEDVDTAVWAGPGLRWAAMGPTLLFHLGGGPGGLASFCQKYTESFHRWWDDLGDPRLDAETAALLVRGVVAESADGSQAELSQARDDLITAMLKTTAQLRRK
ncbi:3-hydroxyacyl-CoA dehydrogenase NAD-binding domain-containing protein [Pseudomonas citronellolis]|uniref:3-hydroxyacyl-CoA dehydrogenase NAD-binding domain-containing protein n=1 Tax=Pseudomonas citronellolis TaxID=53408 RepID=UPI0023E45F84|nr:3-hydroxyacyl-CoA dehydrogenase NAD-binding domain-containing protein [Pseudomonas citronellolis]MDF3933658.1 3-hydroxyacyl-CoA dehydrogenase NAD-binding domain-containing protein [Pseudomonas citronellolis]